VSPLSESAAGHQHSESLLGYSGDVRPSHHLAPRSTQRWVATTGARHSAVGWLVEDGRGCALGFGRGRPPARTCGPVSTMAAYVVPFDPMPSCSSTRYLSCTTTPRCSPCDEGSSLRCASQRRREPSWRGAMRPHGDAGTATPRTRSLPDRSRSSASVGLGCESLSSTAAMRGLGGAHAAGTLRGAARGEMSLAAASP
jgi:hypothetical protein